MEKDTGTDGRMTPDQSRAMALWMQTAPYDRKSVVQDGLAIGGIDPWLLLTPQEQAAAMAALAERRRWTATPLIASHITEISLSRGMCFGECPVYQVTLTTDGHVDFEGEAFVGLIGQHQGFIAPDRVHDLIRVILRLGFAELEPDYPAEVTDEPAKLGLPGTHGGDRQSAARPEHSTELPEGQSTARAGDGEQDAQADHSVEDPVREGQR